MSSVQFVFHCEDPERNQVILTVPQWFDHILARQPDLHGQAERVRRCVERPETVTRDIGFEDRRCYYCSAMIAGAARRELLKVVVHYEDNDHGGSEGLVVTAFPVDRIHPKEEQL